MKEDYYKEVKERKRKQVEERRKENQDRVLLPGEHPTNYPGHSTFMGRIDSTSMRRFYQNRVLTSLVTDEPSIVFDFRFVAQHKRLERIKSLYRQFIEIIGDNRIATRPFQMHFCNYDYSSEFHERFGDLLGLQPNLIQETSKSYLDVFDRSRLVYLSADSRKKMTEYDPNKVYVVGAMIDMSPGEFEYYSYSQAKKDGIACERLPIETASK